MGFYDFKGVWREDGQSFYDTKGKLVNPGGAFYDYKGFLRNPGDGFYDAKGNWVNPGGSFYDGRGYLRSYSTIFLATANTESGMSGIIAFLIFIPIALLWMTMTFAVEWIAAHVYGVYIGYAIADVLVCWIITKTKKHQGIKFMLSYTGNFICILSFIYIVLVNAVPQVIVNGGGFESIFEFILILAFGFGGMCVVQFFNYYHEKAFFEFVLGMVFFVVVVILLKNGTEEINALERLAAIYNVKVSTLFKALFGFAV